MNVHSARTETCRRLCLAALLILSTIVFYLSFAEHPNCLFIGTDGRGLQILMDTLKEFKPPFSQVGADPFEGNFDAYFPLNRDYLVSEALGRLIAGGAPSKAFTFTVNAIFLVLCGYVFGRAVGVHPAVALSAGLLIPIAIMPVWQGQADLVAYPLYSINPYLSQGIGISLLTTASLWQLSGPWHKKLFAWLFLPLGCAIATVAALPDSFALIAPGAVAYGSASFFDAKSWQENLPRLTAVIVAIIGILILGVVEYAYALVKYTAYYYFDREFLNDRQNLSFVSMYFQGSAGAWIIAAAYVGAIYAALFERRQLRILGIAFILTTTAFLIVGYGLVSWAKHYRGISPSYFETYLLPFHLLFCVILIDRILNIGHALPFKGDLESAITRMSRWILPIAIIAIVAGWNISHINTKDPDICRQTPYYVQPTAITDHLRKEIGLVPGQEFRGLVATFNGFVGQSATNLYKLADKNLWWQINNDHRNVGLWSFHIPTLYQYNAFMTPVYYLLLTEFLSRPADEQIRSILVLTRPDEKMLRLWGVRYLITDYDPDIGTVILKMPVRGLNELLPQKARTFTQDVVAPPLPNASAIQQLIQLDDVNLGNYSPTEVRPVTDFAAGLALMHTPDINFHHTVVTNIDIRGPLVPASSARLVLTKMGFDIQGSSVSQSILVLPIQYSRCWTSSSQNVRLFRANLMQLGVLFNGTLNARLTFRYGPFFGAGRCRLQDARDMDRLNISRAR
jgi:hypothetical protein